MQSTVFARKWNRSTPCFCQDEPCNDRLLIDESPALSEGTRCSLLTSQIISRTARMALTSKGSLFSSFRERFWRGAALNASSSEAELSNRSLSSSSAGSSPRKPGLQPKTQLKALDLRALPRDEGPPTELRARRDKFAFFEQECTRVVDGLYLGSDLVARSWETLEAAGITHVVNCVGFIYPAYFEDRLTYKTLYLQGITNVNFNRGY